MTVHELDVGPDAGAVPSGRHFASSALAGLPAELVDAAELVVTELLTNALLHGAAPVRLVVSTDDAGGARLEVHDGSRALPVRPHAGTEGMTGRGLALVDALSAGWGVDRAEVGKVVWAHVTPESARGSEPGDVDLDVLLAGFDDDDEEDARVTVTLGDVPTDLLLAAKAHVDSVVRELTLASTGADSGVTGAVPSSLAQLVHHVVDEFAEARHAIKRQALTASARGETRTTLRLTLSPEAADAGERYLTALEDADAYARSSRLLTLAAPPQHAAFRRWYVTSLVDGLRRATAGGAQVVAPTFETWLLAEVDHLAELQEVSDRAARLQRVTSALARALDRDEVTRTALDDAVAELGATRGVVLVVTERGVRASAMTGYPDEVAGGLTSAWARDVRTPGREAWETGRPVWVETREERDARFPDYGSLEPDVQATCAVPLTVAGHLVGVLRLAFAEARLFNDDERAFVEALAAVAAQALERADLYDARGALAERLSRLQAVTSALAGATGVDAVLDVALEHATGLVGARAASLTLLREDGRSVELARISPPLPDEASWAVFDVDADLPASEAIRERRYAYVPDLAARDARWPAIASIARDWEHSFAVMPLVADGAVLGALSLSFPLSPVEPSQDFLTAFADACAQALGRARTAERAALAHRRLAFLSRASIELAGALDIETTLGNLARLTVPEIADWCVVHLLQDDDLTCVAVEHVDPELRDLAVDSQRRWPESLDDEGVGRVVRTGEAVVIPSVEAARALAEAEGAAPPPPERRALLDRLGLRSVLIVPLTARGRTLGALSLIAAESGRTYGADDLAFAEDLARRVAVSVDNARLYSVATGETVGEHSAPSGLVLRPRAAALPGHADDAVLRWHLAQEAARLGSWELDVASGELTWDEQCAALYGTTEQRFADLADLGGLVHPDDHARSLAALTATVEQGLPFDVEQRVPVAGGGGVRHVLSRGRPVTGPDGGVVRVVGAVVDVTELREAADAESRAARVTAGLGDVALRLAAASTVDDLTRVVIEDGLVLLGADGGAVCVRDDAAFVVRLAVSDSLGDRVPLEYGELPLDGPLPGSVSAYTGREFFLPDRSTGLAVTDALETVYEATGREAWASLPLRAGGRLLGSLVVSWTDERAFAPQDEELLRAFAAQCAQALDRIQTLDAERRAAQAARRLSETLQRSLLTRPPQPDHLQVAVRYAPASQEAQVGGDWYDAFFTRDGALSVVIGDCSGHDREAVAAMAAVRNLLRATAYAVDGTPADVLTALEHTMAGLDVQALATALLARVEQTAEQHARGVRTVAWSSAGHLPPVVRRAGGDVVVLDTVPDLMLGLLPDTDRGDHSVELEAGATVVLYTDGLVERRGEDLDAGVERLRRLLDAVGGRPLDEVCDLLVERLGRDAEDDVALVAVRLHPEDRPRPPEAGPARVPDSRPLAD